MFRSFEEEQSSEKCFEARTKEKEMFKLPRSWSVVPGQLHVGTSEIVSLITWSTRELERAERRKNLKSAYFSMNTKRKTFFRTKELSTNAKCEQREEGKFIFFIVILRQNAFLSTLVP